VLHARHPALVLLPDALPRTRGSLTPAGALFARGWLCPRLPRRSRLGPIIRAPLLAPRRVSRGTGLACGAGFAGRSFPTPGRRPLRHCSAFGIPFRIPGRRPSETLSCRSSCGTSCRSSRLRPSSRPGPRRARSCGRRRTGPSRSPSRLLSRRTGRNPCVRPGPPRAFSGHSGRQWRFTRLKPPNMFEQGALLLGSKRPRLSDR
jgi:hypothetical protein